MFTIYLFANIVFFWKTWKNIIKKVFPKTRLSLFGVRKDATIQFPHLPSWPDWNVVFVPSARTTYRQSKKPHKIPHRKASGYRPTKVGQSSNVGQSFVRRRLANRLTMVGRFPEALWHGMQMLVLPVPKPIREARSDGIAAGPQHNLHRHLQHFFRFSSLIPENWVSLQFKR